MFCHTMNDAQKFEPNEWADENSVIWIGEENEASLTTSNHQTFEP